MYSQGITINRMLRFFNVTCFPLCPLHTYNRGFPSIDDYILDEYLISSQF